MNRLSLLMFVVGALIAANIQAQSPMKTRVDALGDPLPEGAVARIGTVRFKHSPEQGGTIDNALFSPDGSKIVSLVVGAGSIRLWNAESGKEISGPWNNTYPRYSAVAFSPDGAQLAAAINLGFRPNNNANGINSQVAINIFDLADPTKTKNLSGQPQMVQAMVFADGGKTLVAAGDGTVRWWDLATGKEKKSWTPFADEKPKMDQQIPGQPNNGQQTKTFSHCYFSPDAKTIALQVDWRSNNQNGFIQRNGGQTVVREAMGYDLAKGEMLWRSTGKGGRFSRSYFAYSADGKSLAMAIGTGKVELRDTATGKLIMNPLDSKYAENNELGGLALSPDGSTIALAGKDSNILLWNIKEPAAPRELWARIAQNGPHSTAFIEFSPDSKKLLVGVDADLQIYDVATLQEIHPWEGHRGWVDRLAFTSDGKRLLTGSAGRSQSGGEYFGPNGEIYYIVSLGGAGEFPSLEQAAWEVGTWKRLRLTSVRTPPWPNFGRASLDQSLYVGKSDEDRFSLFDMKTGRKVGRFTLPEKQLTPGVGVFSPGGKRYLQYFRNNQGKESERLYAVPSGKLVCQFPSVSNRNQRSFLSQTPGDSSKDIAFSHDERLVARFGQGDGTVQVFDTATGKLLRSLGKKIENDENRNFAFGSTEVAFSRDSKYLASWSSQEKIIRLWDLSTGMEISQIAPDGLGNIGSGNPYEQNRITLSWSPDSRMLAMGENKIRLWEMATLGIRRELVGHQNGRIRALEFSPGGEVLASAGTDTTVLIWDMAMKDRPALSDKGLEKGTLEKHWRALAEDDAARAFSAILDLASVPQESLVWIREHIKPAIPIDSKRVDKLIEDLNDNQYKLRQNATTELLQMGDRVVPSIDKALTTKPALETLLRLQDVRKRLVSPVLKKEVLRANRSVEVLERIGTPEARELLQVWAQGTPGAMLTRQAGSALERMGKSELR